MSSNNNNNNNPLHESNDDQKPEMKKSSTAVFPDAPSTENIMNDQVEGNENNGNTPSSPNTLGSVTNTAGSLLQLPPSAVAVAAGTSSSSPSSLRQNNNNQQQPRTPNSSSTGGRTGTAASLSMPPSSTGQRNPAFSANLLQNIEMMERSESLGVFDPTMLLLNNNGSFAVRNNENSTALNASTTMVTPPSSVTHQTIGFGHARRNVSTLARRNPNPLLTGTNREGTNQQAPPKYAASPLMAALAPSVQLSTILKASRPPNNTNRANASANQQQKVPQQNTSFTLPPPAVDLNESPSSGGAATIATTTRINTTKNVPGMGLDDAEPLSPDSNNTNNALFQNQQTQQQNQQNTQRQASANTFLNATALAQNQLQYQQEHNVRFARSALQDFGSLAPIELAMLQAEIGSNHASEHEQLTAAEILASIERLNAAEFALLAEATYENIAHGLTSHLMYSGEAWYLPQIADCGPDEEQNSITYKLHEGLKIALFGKKVTIRLISMMMRVIFLVMVWISLYMMLGKDLLSPGGYIFDPVACFIVCSIVGGIIGRIVSMPPLFFILGMAILWTNVAGYGELTKGITPKTRQVISRVALTVISLRSGLSMNWKTIEPAAANIMSMSIFPLLAEVLVHGFTATSIMDYGDSKLWPFLQAMVAAPGASAVVGATVLLMRTWGFGITRGPGVLMIPAVVFDMVLGVWGISFMMSLVFRNPDSNLAWTIAQGPLQIIVGPIAGIAVGWIWIKVLDAMFREAKVLPHGKYARAFIRSRARISLVAMIFFGICLVYGGYEIYAPGGGILACVFFGASAGHFMSAEDAPSHYAQVKSKQFGYFAAMWDLLLMPAVFSVTSSTISVSTMFAGHFVGKALACLFAGMAARIVTCAICTASYPMTLSERIIGNIASAGRAGLQVLLGPIAVNHVANLPGGGTPEQQQYANQVYDTAILALLIMVPIPVVLLTRVAPALWLTDAEHEELEGKEKKKKEQEEEEQELVNKKKEATTTTSANEPMNEEENKKTVETIVEEEKQ